MGYSLQCCALGLVTVSQAMVGFSQTVAPGTSTMPTPQQAPRTPQQMRAFFASHFTKREYQVPMRDGVKLYTAVYTPVAAQFADKGPYPFLMTRTPYSCAPYGVDKIAPRVTGNQKLLEGGYILVCQDVRGRWDSQGTWLEMTPSKDGKGIDESTDTFGYGGLAAEKRAGE